MAAANKKKKSLASSTKSAACQARCRLHHLSDGIVVVRPFLQNEISPPCIMLKQTCDPCPGLAVRFPFPYTFLVGLAVLPQRPGQLPMQISGADQTFFIQF